MTTIQRKIKDIKFLRSKRHFINRIMKQFRKSMAELNSKLSPGMSRQFDYLYPENTFIDPIKKQKYVI